MVTRDRLERNATSGGMQPLPGVASSTGGFMNFKVAILCALSTTTLAGCKGGGGGGWLVGTSGLMANVIKGKLGQGYDLGTATTLNGIACRYQDEAWVVG